MGIFTPAWKNKDINKRVIAIYKMSKKRALSIIDKLTDQNIISDFAHYYNETEVRLKAVEKLTDKKLLYYIAENTGRMEVLFNAAEKLSDQSLLMRRLKQLCNSEADYNNCFSFIEKLTTIKKPTEQEVYANSAKFCHATAYPYLSISLACKDDDFRMNTLNNVTDKHLLIDIVKNGDNVPVCMAAIEKLNNSDLAQELYVYMQPKLAKFACSTEALSDMNYYAKGGEPLDEFIATMIKKRVYYKIAAIEKLTTHSALTKIMNGGELFYVYIFLSKKGYKVINSHHMKINNEYITLDLRETAHKRLVELRKINSIYP